jgi:starch phosphorylase
VIPRFNAGRMMRDYVVDYYLPASRHGAALADEGAAAARSLASWKRLVHAHWNEVRLVRIDSPVEEVEAGDTLRLRVGVRGGPFSAEDIRVEFLLGPCPGSGDLKPQQVMPFRGAPLREDGQLIYELELEASMSGLQCYKIRAYPYHPSLAHPFETGHMLWL